MTEQKRKVTTSQSFSFRAPGATSVMLVGDFTHWQQTPLSLRKQADGVWRATVALEPGEHRYRFLVDGDWRDDPECTVRVPNPYGTYDAVIKVESPAAGAAVAR